MKRILPENTTVRLLVVEDEPTARRGLCQVLEALGYTCAAASNGAEALVRVGEFRPQAIIMDVMMPVLDGLETTRRLKADPATSGIPVLALTANTGSEAQEQAFLAGVDGFLAKPTDLDLLVEHLQQHVAVPLSSR